MPALARAGALVLGSLFLADAVDNAGEEVSFTCGNLKDLYKEQCLPSCHSPETVTMHHAVPLPHKALFTTNPCHDSKPGLTMPLFQNDPCVVNGVIDTLEQAGANITVGYDGGLDVEGRVPINTTYHEAGICPVNVHWHLGTEHYSLGEFDEFGVGPAHAQQDDLFGEDDSRRLAAARLGFRCHHYDNTSAAFTTEYNWKHCQDMYVGETYEVHWPHSRGGLCGSPWQYQTPFYDGVFCDVEKATRPSTQESIGVQGQIFTIINDEDYYYPDLFRGMIVDGQYGRDMTYYTGSTTGTSRNNEICSNYAPITWQVDRKCHLISASSFDKMCADMLQQADDMSSDTHAHGSRILVQSTFVANNFQFATSD